MKPYIIILLFLCRLSTIIGNDVIPISSSWRSVQNGDWIISFFQDYVIYDNQFWKYQKTNEDTLKICNGDTVLNVVRKMVGNGYCNIKIGSKMYACQEIEGQTLCDYPIKDQRIGLKDNHFCGGDSVTIIGWLKDMPESEKNKDSYFSAVLYNILTDEKESYSAKLDSIGRFSFKFPITNTSQVSLDWYRSTLSLPLEPNESYFLLVDFSDGKRLVMGQDSRLQNEIIATKEVFRGNSRVLMNIISDTLSVAKYDEETRSNIQKRDSIIKSCLKEHPSLSQRWVNYSSGYWFMDRAFNLGQARFNKRPLKLPKYAELYAKKNYWEHLPVPYSTYYWASFFFNDYLGSLFFDKKHENDFIKDMQDVHDIVLTPEEDSCYVQYRELNREKNKQISLETKVSSAEKFIKHWKETHNAEYSFIDELNKKYGVDSILKQNKSFYLFRRYAAFLDTVCYNRELKDICMTRFFYAYLGQTKNPLPEKTIEQLKLYINNSILLDILLKRNEKYIPVANNVPYNVLNDSLRNISDGEKLLHNLVAPFRGKLILIDFWGTWCGPCRAYLAKSQQEYQALKDYDIVYLYLANRTPDLAWKNAIREYNVQGPNVVHYNLPEVQQSAIEHYLNVTGFPSFRLIDKQGNLYKDKVNPRNMSDFISILQNIQ